MSLRGGIGIDRAGPDAIDTDWLFRAVLQREVPDRTLMKSIGTLAQPSGGTNYFQTYDLEQVKGRLLYFHAASADYYVWRFPHTVNVDSAFEDNYLANLTDGKKILSSQDGDTFYVHHRDPGMLVFGAASALTDVRITPGRRP